MSSTIDVYWSNVPNTELDMSIAYEDPRPLMHELTLNRNNSNKDDNLLRCPAVTDLGKNLFVIKNPLQSSASFIIENGKVSSAMESRDRRWSVNRPPSLNNQLLAAYDYSIIFFAEEDIDVMITAPYFSHTPHSSWGAVVPGVYNCGAWFRPINMEFNVWPGITEVSLQENEPMAYAKFFTEKNVVLKRFSITPELMAQAKSCSSAGFWEPRVPLLKRYERFRNSKRNKFVLDKIKQNIL